MKGKTHMTAVAVARSSIGNHADEMIGPPNERKAEDIPLRAIAPKWTARVGVGAMLNHSGKHRAQAPIPTQAALATAGMRMPYRLAAN